MSVPGRPGQDGSPLTVPLRHYYHLWAAGAWEQPVTEHVTALATSGLEASMVVGLVGDRAERTFAKRTLTRLLKGSGLGRPSAWAEADTGWEQVTLRKLRRDAARLPPFNGLYCHTKGSYTVTPYEDRWRRGMTAAAVGGWRDAVALLDAGHGTAGCHLVHRDEWFYAGNFWWARSDYLRKLPVPPDGSRWQAETWAPPDGGEHAACILPGWPS